MPTKFRPITHIITGTAPVNPWPPTGSYLLCARLYTNTFLDHITVNTVSWNYDGGSSPTYADANCTQVLNYLSGWDDGTVNTVLQTTGQNEYGTYVDIFTDNSRSTESAIDFCVILGNDRRQTITDDSWKITRVEVFKVGMSNGIYRVNNSPSKGQWFRNRNDWTEFPLTPSSSTIFRPISIFENVPGPSLPPFTLRLKYEDGVIPNFRYGTGVQVSSSPNIWDLKYENTTWNYLLWGHGNLLEVIDGNTTGVTSMDCMFYGCTSLTSVPLFDTSNVTNMNNMFFNCSSLNIVPIFDTSNVTNMNWMVGNCPNVQSGALALYQQASTQSNPPIYHNYTFHNCGLNTTTGAAELAQIPDDWK